MQPQSCNLVRITEKRGKVFRFNLFALLSIRNKMKINKSNSHREQIRTTEPFFFNAHLKAYLGAPFHFLHSMTYSKHPCVGTSEHDCATCEFLFVH